MPNVLTPAFRSHDSSLALQVLPFSPTLWDQISDDWTALVEARPDASVFVSSSWIAGWLAAFGDELRPEALTWRNGKGECVGACLLTVRRERRGPFTVRRAYLNATGEHQLASEHNVILCSLEYETGVYRAFVDHLRRRRIDSFVAAGFGEQAIDAIGKAWPPAGSREGYVSEDRFVALDKLRTQGTSYLASLSRNTREKIRRSMRLYEETLGPVAIEFAATPDEARASFAELRDLHEARWRARGLPGAFATPESRRFHESLIVQSVAKQPTDPHQLSADVIRIRYGEVVIGVLYNFIYRGTVSFYQSGLHYTDDNRLKPGLVTHSLAIQSYLDAGASTYDFLAGETEGSQYKESLSSDRRALVWQEYAIPNLKMRLIDRLRSWREQQRARTHRPSDSEIR